ncbi:effector binding domain-containing protein [Serratia ureilytica]
MTIEQGEYARFTYQGQEEGLQNFIVRLYDTAMPQMNAIRRPGQDIELFYPAQEAAARSAARRSAANI